MIEPYDPDVNESQRVRDVGRPLFEKFFRQLAWRCISRTRRVIMIANAPSLRVSRRVVPARSDWPACCSSRVELFATEGTASAEVFGA
jgi:hypothetical protein